MRMPGVIKVELLLLSVGLLTAMEFSLLLVTRGDVGTYEDSLLDAEDDVVPRNEAPRDDSRRGARYFTPESELRYLTESDPEVDPRM